MSFNAAVLPKRQLVLDLETTGLLIADGHRVIEVAVVELLDGKPSGVEYHALVNPDRAIPAEVSAIHGITDDKVADKPAFAAIAQELRQFIANDEIIITCRTKDGYTLDIAFLDMEFEKAGQPKTGAAQWINVRRWSEAMFMDGEATLDAVLDRYKIDRSNRTQHGALLDARLLAEAYPPLLNDYLRFDGVKKPLPPKPGV